jgi:dUTP pyrophosphatase
MKLQIINHSNNELPSYQTNGSAGMDLRAFIDEIVVLKPLERQLISTGLFIALPNTFEAQIRPRSGLAYKHGLTVLNTPGTIDSDYRGEIKVLLINMSSKPFSIQSGDRIAQMVIAKFEQVDLLQVEELIETSRNDAGFGSTGTN